MIKNLAARYKKTRIQEGIYVYRFVEVLQNVEYNALEDTIEIVKNEEKKTIYDMEDVTFTITDEKNCFSDYADIDTLRELYGDLKEEEILEQFKENCTSFIRFGIFDEKQESLKIVSSKIDDLLKAEPEENSFTFALMSYINDNEIQAIIPYEVLKQMINDMEKEKNDKVLRALCQIKNSAEFLLSQQEDLQSQEEEKEEEVSEKEELDINQDLNSLVGLNDIKKEVEKLKAYLSFLKNSDGKLNLEIPNLNMVFYGNPGTGKTTVARIISKILYSLGYIKSDQFKEVTTGDFIAGYIGQTAIKTKDLINKNKGGVIFIDEAYSFDSKAQDFADEALVEILKEMEKKDTVFIFAGYTEEMKNFISMNPGIQSRVSTYLKFKDYSIEELMDIFQSKIENSKLKITEEALHQVRQIVEKVAYSDKKFGNARFIIQLFNKILMYHALNTVNEKDEKVIYTITENDITEQLYQELNINNKQKKLDLKEEIYDTKTKRNL